MADPASTCLPSLFLALVSAYSLCLPPTPVSEHWHRQRDLRPMERKSSAGAQHNSSSGRWRTCSVSQPCTQETLCLCLLTHGLSRMEAFLLLFFFLSFFLSQSLTLSPHSEWPIPTVGPLQGKEAGSRHRRSGICGWQKTWKYGQKRGRC